jgi:predicted O-methyltransferase YrrM
MLAKSLRSKLETLGWYARRPEFYPELFRKLLKAPLRSATHYRRDKELGREWCASVVTSRELLFTELGLPDRAVPVSELHADVWREAKLAVEACPIKMGGPADVTVLYHLARHLPARRCIETGVASGWSTLALLLAMRESGGGKLVSIDMPYAKLDNDPYVGCAVPQRLRGGTWTLIRNSDRGALEPALRELGVIDLAHYDSDKSYDGRMYAYEGLWRALRPRGLLMSDDVEDNLAFRDFCAKIGRKGWVLEKSPGTYAGVLAK